MYSLLLVNWYEWEATLAVLNSGKQWEEMWQLAQKAPAIWSRQLLQKLNQVAWLPKAEQEQVGFERLKQFSDKCSTKIPQIGKLTSGQATLTGHNGWIQGISFSPDGQLLASCSGDKTIRLWQIPDVQPMATLTTGHTKYISGISFSPDGQLLASYSKDKTIRLWSSPVFQLSCLPIQQLCKQNREWIQKTLELLQKFFMV